MKILLVDSLIGNDYSICLCSALSKIKCDVSMVTTEDRETDLIPNFQIMRWAPSKKKGTLKINKTFNYLKYLYKIVHFALRAKPDIIHFQFFRKDIPESLFYSILNRLKITLVYTAHNVLPHERRKADFFFKLLVLKSSRAIIVHSRSLKKMLTYKFKINPNKIAIIPHGNFDIYLPKEKLSQAISRKKLGLFVNDNVMLFFGNIREYKGLDLLLQAFRIASKHDEYLKLVIAGSPYSKKLENYYQELIAMMKLDDRILFHSKFIPNSKISLYFEASDLVMLPYKNIYHSGIMHLAFSFGKPVIATRVGDFEEIIEWGKNGFLVNKGDYIGMAKIITDAFQDKNKLKEMGELARILNKEKYSWVNIAEMTNKLYEKCAKATPYQA